MKKVLAFIFSEKEFKDFIDFLLSSLELRCVLNHLL